jgi:hypothetical protein
MSFGNTAIPVTSRDRSYQRQPTIGAAIAAARFWFLWVRCPACRTRGPRKSASTAGFFALGGQGTANSGAAPVATLGCLHRIAGTSRAAVMVIGQAKMRRPIPGWRPKMRPSPSVMLSAKA